MPQRISTAIVIPIDIVSRCVWLCFLYSFSHQNLHEVYLWIDGQNQYLWPAVDRECEMIDILVQSHRELASADPTWHGRRNRFRSLDSAQSFLNNFSLINNHLADITKVQELLGHANISMAQLCDRRLSRPGDSAAFRVRY